MTDLGSEFDAEQISPAQAFDTIPSGKYLVELVDSDKRLTKNGKGEYLWLEFQILDGDHQGRKLWDRLNLWHPNQQTVDIAQKTFSALCHAAGKLQVRETTVLHNIPLIATVRYRPPEDPAKAAEEGRAPYDASNEIRGYVAAKGKAPAVASTSPPAASAPWKVSQRRP